MAHLQMEATMAVLGDRYRYPTETHDWNPAAMSTRTYALSIKSLDPIRNAIASQDQAAFDAVVAEYDADDEDRREYAKSMILIDNPPAKEPGCWNYVVAPLAKHLGLQPDYLAIDDWKHYGAWEDYTATAKSHISDESLSLLEHIKSGRPFRGSEIAHDGCLFGWLANAECKALLDSLRDLDAEAFRDLDELHEELIDSLQTVVDNDADMFIGAS